MRVGGLIVCGGQSSRMGRPKAWLPFGPEIMLPRVVRILQEVVSPIVVVAAPRQDLPPLPASVVVARDEHEGRGPLAGMAAGLAALRETGEVDAAYVSACDAPLLQPAFVRELLTRLGDADLAIPRDGQYHHPLAAVYRLTVEPHIRALLAADRLRPFFLLERVCTVEVPVEELRGCDPELRSLRNTNTPEEYARALQDAGFTVAIRDGEEF